MPELDDLPSGSRRVHDDSAAIGVLRERVETQGGQIRSLAAETATQFREFRADTSRLFGDMTTTLKALDAKLDTNNLAFNTKLENSVMAAQERQRPQYLAVILAMIAAVGLSVTIVQWQTAQHDRPYDTELLNIKTAMVQMTATIGDIAKASPSNKTFDQTVDFMNQISALKTANNLVVLGKIQAQIDRVEAKSIPRDELEYKQKIADERAANVEKRLDTLTPTGDVIKNLIERQHEIELKIYGRPKE